jgi:hypothetical protein
LVRHGEAARTVPTRSRAGFFVFAFRFDKAVEANHSGFSARGDGLDAVFLGLSVKSTGSRAAITIGNLCAPGR